MVDFMHMSKDAETPVIYLARLLVFKQVPLLYLKNPPLIIFPKCPKFTLRLAYLLRGKRRNGRGKGGSEANKKNDRFEKTPPR